MLDQIIFKISNKVDQIKKIKFHRIVQLTQNHLDKFNSSVYSQCWKIFKAVQSRNFQAYNCDEKL